MKARIWLVAILIGVAFGVLPRPIEAQNQGPSDAWVLDIKCKAEYTTSGMTKQLSKADVGLALQAGDKVRCLGQGHVLLQVPEGEKTVTSSDQWITITPIPRDPPYPEIAAALKRYGQPGASRSMATIFWPAMDSVILPKDFVIRWVPLQSRVRFVIETESSHGVIWGPADTEGSNGEWAASNARAALADYQAGGAQENLLLVLTTSDDRTTDKTRFSLLDLHDQTDVQKSLEFWSHYHNHLAALLGRGYVFSRYRLYEEAAKEYEAAVAEAPESRYLLQEAIVADRHSGRFGNMETLLQRLRALNQKD